MAWTTRCPHPGCDLDVVAVDTVTEKLRPQQGGEIDRRSIESYCPDDHACPVVDARWDGRWHIRPLGHEDEREQTDDPRGAGGAMIGGGSQDRDSVVFDARRAVLVEQYEVAVAHTTQEGRPGPDRVALLVRGRINRPPDGKTQHEAPAEPVEHLHMTSWEQAADLVANLYALASRDGRTAGAGAAKLGQFNDQVRRCWAALEGEGHT